MPNGNPLEDITYNPIHTDLNFGSYIESKAKTAVKKLGILSKVRHYFTLGQLLTLYQALVRSCMEYCSHLWDGSAQYQLEALDAIDRRARRLIGDDELVTNKLQSLEHRRKVACLSVFYRIHFVSHWEVIYVCELCFLLGVQAARLPPKEANFGITSVASSILDATLPILKPLVAAGSNKCEMLKSFFGITYEQMSEKNATDYQSKLSVDVITKNGTYKYNLTAIKALTKRMANATKVVVLIHGFLEKSDGLMVQGLSPDLLKKPGYLILALDGGKLINLEYFRSSTYARFMGEHLGTMLGKIVKNGEDPEKITLIGHSLGAHIAGITGQRVQELTGRPLGRIVGLDPAGPCFSGAGVDPGARLDSSDAAYVDVIHTNAGVLGISEPVGHKDFYPNGGISQPGCYLSMCDHSRVWEFFAESILTPHHFPARKCQNYTLFLDGACSKNEVAYMGLNSEAGSPGTYFLTTAPTAPYGLGGASSG